VQEQVKVAVVTASDKCSKGERSDVSGDIIVDAVLGWNGLLVERRVIPDVREQISSALIELCDSGEIDLVITTGGTGFTARDLTPEATLDVIQREAPGIAEALRAEGLKKTPHAMLSRGVAGIRERTLIVNLPGSTKAVREGLSVLAPIVAHATETLRSTTGVDCGKRSE